MKSFRASSAVMVVLLAFGATVPVRAFEPAAPQATAQATIPPTLMSLDGALKTPEGEARTGTVVLVVALYAAQDDATPLWVERQVVTLDAAGRYAIVAGSTQETGVPPELFVSGGGRWIGVAVEGEAEQPRAKLVTVPYALKAREADTLTGRSSTDFVLADRLTDSVKAALKAEGVVGPTLDALNALTPAAIPRFADGGGTLEDSGLFAFPAGPQLRIANSTTGKNWDFFNYRDFNLYLNNAGGTRLTVADGGNVGIGADAPAARLEVVSTGANRSLRLRNSSVNTSWDFYSYSDRNLYLNNAGGTRLTVLDGGNVGIGSDAPAAKLEVSATGGVAALRLKNSTANTSWDLYSYSDKNLYFNNAGGTRLTILDNGNVQVGGSMTVDGNLAAKYQDVAEWVETPTPLDAATVVIVDPHEPNRVLAASRAYDTRVAGAVSRQPGLVLGERSDSKALVAQSGRVKVKADAKYGAIKIGDLLVTSPTPGYAMRSRPLRVGGQSLHRPGTLLGKALEALPSGQGEILVLLTLQ